MASVKLPSLLIFTNQFAAMLGSKLPLLSVLENLGKETPQPVLRDAIEDICESVTSGVELADALEEFPGIFDEIYVNVVRAGLGSGRLDESLLHLSEHLSNADQVSRQLRGALAYPMFMFAGFIAAFNGMVFFILPRFQSMFSSMDKELPAITQLLMDIGDWWKASWPLVLGFWAVVIASFVIWTLTPDGRYLWNKMKLNIPVIGNMLRLGAMSRFLRTFAVQVRNEVNILQALRLAAPSSGNAYLEEVILDIADDIERGRGIAEAFREHEVFSGIVLQMIASGEEAGQLDELLLSASDYFTRLLDNQIQTWTGMINPILTVVIGLGIAGMMVAVFLPVFDLGSAVH